MRLLLSFQSQLSHDSSASLADVVSGLCSHVYSSPLPLFEKKLLSLPFREPVMSCTSTASAAVHLGAVYSFFILPVRFMAYSAWYAGQNGVRHLPTWAFARAHNGVGAVTLHVENVPAWHNKSFALFANMRCLVFKK